VPVFCLTNFGSYSYEEARDKLDFLGEFDREYVSGRLKVSKPDPRIFQAVEDDSGIAPDRLLFADDKAENIVAAARRGWRPGVPQALLLPTSRPPRFPRG